MAYSVLQSASLNDGTNGHTSIAVPFATANLTAGTKLIALVSISSTATRSVSSVKDGAGNSFTQIVHAVIPTTSGDVSLWAMDTPAGDVGTKPTITATFNLSVGASSILVQEVSGLATGNTLAAMIDGTGASKTGTATGATGSPTYSTTATGEYLVCCQGDDGGPMTGTLSGYTLDSHRIDNNSNANANLGWKNSTGGAETGSWSLSGTATGWVVLLAAFKLAAAGPNNFTAPITDTLPAESDSIGRTQTLIRAIADSLPSFAESIARIQTLARTVADSLPSFSDSFTAVRTFARGITDTLPSFSDATTRAQTLARQIIDSLPGSFVPFPQYLPFKGSSPTSSTTDILTPHGLMLGRAMTDDLAFVPLTPAGGLTDAVSRVLSFGRQIADSVNGLFTDTMARSTILARQINEALATSDSVQRAAALTRAVSESLSGLFSDVISRGWSGARSLSETITTSETLGRVATYSRQITDSIASLLSDTISAIKNGGGGTNYVRSITDTLPVIADGVTRLFTGARSLIETATTSDSVTRAQTLARQISVTLTTTETIARVWNGVRSLSETLTTTDTVTRAATYARQITDSVSGLFSDAVTAVKNSHAYTATVTDTLPVISDSLSRGWSGARQIAETIATSDVVQRAAAFVRPITGTLPTFSDSMSRVQGFVRQMAETLATNDAVQRVAGYARQAAETITTADSVQRAASYGRQVADTVSNLFSDIISTIKNLIVHKPGACTVSIAPTYSAALSLAPTYTCTVSIDN